MAMNVWNTQDNRRQEEVQLNLVQFIGFNAGLKFKDLACSS